MIFTYTSPEMFQGELLRSEIEQEHAFRYRLVSLLVKTTEG